MPVIVACAVIALLGATAATAAGRGAQLRFQTLRVVDPIGGDIEAFRLLVPRGWIWKGGVQWNLSYANLASVAMRVRNPRGLEAVESFPLFPQVWNDTTQLGPVGSNYLGMEVRPPLDAAGFLRQLVIPTLRGGLAPRVLAVRRLPAVARSLSAFDTDPTVRSTYDAARVRIRYRDGGRSIDEDFHVAIQYSRSQILPGQLLWQPLFLYSFKAGQGALDRASRVLQAIVSSVRPSLAWYAGYRRLSEQWVQGQLQAIRAAGAVSRAISDANASITASTRQAWESQQAAYDRVYESASEQIRGVETYDDPVAGRPVQLPSDYGYAWVSARGEYALSNDAGFDPNVGSTIDWRLLKPS